MFDILKKKDNIKLLFSITSPNNYRHIVYAQAFTGFLFEIVLKSIALKYHVQQILHLSCEMYMYKLNLFPVNFFK